MKAGVNLADNLIDPKTALSQEPIDSTFNRTFGCETIFDFYDRPENAHRLRNFGAAMHGINVATNFTAVMAGNLSPFDGANSDVDRLSVRSIRLEVIGTRCTRSGCWWWCWVVNTRIVQGLPSSALRGPGPTDSQCSCHQGTFAHKKKQLLCLHYHSFGCIVLGERGP